MEDKLTSAADLPYFEGDFWPNVLEESIKELDQQEEEKRKLAEAAEAAAAAANAVSIYCVSSAREDAMLSYKNFEIQVSKYLETCDFYLVFRCMCMCMWLRIFVWNRLGSFEMTITRKRLETALEISHISGVIKGTASTL